MRLVAQLTRHLRRHLDSQSPYEPTLTDITRLFRNPPQLGVLARFVGDNGAGIRAAVHAVADGAEAVSLLLTLDPSRTHRPVRIDAFDIRNDYLDRANAWTFTTAHFPDGQSPVAYPDYFEAQNDEWRLREAWRASIHYAAGDVCALDDRSARYDIVLCQNLLISLTDACRQVAVRGLAAWTRPGGLLVIGGGPLGEIPGLVIREGFVPVLDDVDRIHEAWTVQRRFYDNPRRPYWALEPFDARHPDGPVRYCTIFRKSASASVESS